MPSDDQPYQPPAAAEDSGLPSAHRLVPVALGLTTAAYGALITCALGPTQLLFTLPLPEGGVPFSETERLAMWALIGALAAGVPAGIAATVRQTWAGPALLSFAACQLLAQWAVSGLRFAQRDTLTSALLGALPLSIWPAVVAIGALWLLRSSRTPPEP